jgi:hypothetical protein
MATRLKEIADALLIIISLFASFKLATIKEWIEAVEWIGTVFFAANVGEHIADKIKISGKEK